MLAPAVIVTGAVSPERLNPVPLTLACDIVRAAVPVFETFTVWVAEVFTVRLPKLSAAGVTLIAGVEVATPVPVRLTTAGELPALLVIEMLPEAAPAAVG
jgi:hypothetical protein